MASRVDQIGTGMGTSQCVGEYEVDWERKLGEGAFGSVYHGRHIPSHTQVAIKIVSSDRVKEHELQLICKAQSSCVVRLYEVLKEDPLTYIIMELCQTDLSSFLNSYGKLNEPNLAMLTRCLAEGYLVLHRHAILHRDIKPQNILLKIDSIFNSNGAVNTDSPRKLDSEQKQPAILIAKFADFGCSRVKDEAPANCAGTFLYMAPEVGANLVNSNRYDEAVDMWSIGIVLYQAMTGRVPFSEQQLCRLFLRAVDQNYTSYTAPEFDQDEEEGVVDGDSAGSSKRMSRLYMMYRCYKHYRDIIQRLLQLNPSARLNPLQFHAFAAHDQPSSFLRCLNEGSCSNTQTASGILEHTKLCSSVLAVRRTASGVFSRIRNVVSGCRN